jgi:hypothetical protein
MYLLWLLLEIALITVSLALVTKVATPVAIDWGRSAMIAVIVALLAQIPWVGWGFSIFALVALTRKLAQADPWPDVAIVFFASWVVPYLLMFLLAQRVSGA